MKKLVLVAISSIVLIIPDFAQTSLLILNDNFSGLSNGNLGQANGNWTNTNNNSPVLVNNSGALSNSYYTGGGHYVTINNSSNGDDPYKKFNNNQSIPATANTVVYYSFLVRVDDVSGTVNAGNNAQAVLALGNNGSNDRLGFFIGNNGNGTNNLKFGIQKTGSNGGTFASSNYTFGTTHLVVIKYEYVSGNNNDLMYLWIDPIISAYSEPSISSASLVINSGSDNSLNLNSIGFTQTNNGAVASFDAIRTSYATNWNSASANSLSAWMSLSAAGGQPLAVKFGPLKATAIGKNIKVEWEIYSEENMLKYSIEKSIDGNKFEKLGETTATNSIEKSSYNFTDTSPIDGNNFYRVRSTDKTGKELISNIVKLNMGMQGAASFALYPNPVKNSSFSIQLNNFSRSVYYVQIIDPSGNVVYKTEVSLSGIASTQNYQLGAVLSPGRYNVLINGNGLKLVRSLLVL